MKSRILIIAPRKSLPFNEAWSKNILYLSRLLNAEVISTAKLTGFFQKVNNYTIINDYPLFYPLLFLYLLCSLYFKKYDWILLAANPSTIFFHFLLKLIPPHKLILNFRGKINLPAILKIKNLRRFIAEEEFVYNKLSNLGYDVYFSRPYIDPKIYPYLYRYPIKENFTFLFASAPLPHQTFPESFIDKGIYLLLDAFKNASIPKKKLILIWRQSHVENLIKYINEHHITGVQVINKIVNINDYLKKAHATILVPRHNFKHSSDYPLSILESLSTGRPVIISNDLELSSYIKKYYCGITCSPSVSSLTNAMENLHKNYNFFQKNTNDFISNYLKKTNPKDIVSWFERISSLCSAKKIAFFWSHGIGDFVVATPILKKIKKVFPCSKITYITVKTPFENLFRDSPYVDEVVQINKLNKINLIFDLMRLRKTEFDLAFAPFPTRMSSKIVAKLIKTKKLIESQDNYLSNKNIVEKGIETLKSSGIKINPGDKKLEWFFSLNQNTSEIKLFLERINGDGKELVIVIHVGSRHIVSKNLSSTHFWEPKKWTEVIRYLTEHYKAKVILIGSSEDEDQVDKILAQTLDKKNVVNAVNKFTVQEIAALIRQCNFLISTNSGPMWIAAALRKPQVTLCGPSFYQWEPYNKKAIVIRKNLNRKYCNPPCNNKECKYQDNLCMEKIAVKDIKMAIDKIIQQL